MQDGEPVTRDNAVEMIEHWLGYHERSDLFGFWAAIERATGRFLGWFDFRPDDGHGDDEPELGYRLIASAWGKGLATEGSIALIDRGFSTGRPLPPPLINLLVPSSRTLGASAFCSPIPAAPMRVFA